MLLPQLSLLGMLGGVVPPPPPDEEPINKATPAGWIDGMGEDAWRSPIHQPVYPQNPQDRSALDRELALMLGHHDLPTPALRMAVPARVTALQPDLDMAMVLMLIAIDDDE